MEKTCILSVGDPLDVTKANGHDNISAIMLKETAMSITPVITELLEKFLMSGKLHALHLFQKEAMLLIQ